MTILDIAEAFDLTLIVKYLPNLQKWHAFFDGVEIKDTKESVILRSKYGSDKNLNVAVDEYIMQIKGKHAVVNAMSKINRFDFRFPVRIECFCDIGSSQGKQIEGKDQFSEVN